MSGEREREERLAEIIYNSQDNPQDDSYAFFCIVIFIVCAIVVTPIIIKLV